MVTALFFAICFAVSTTEGSKICADVLKALIGARHAEFHRDFVSVKQDLQKVKKEFKTFQDQLQNIGTGKVISVSACRPEHFVADTEHNIPLSHIIRTMSTPVIPLSIIAKRQIGGKKSTNSSVLGTYIRWGRTACPNGATVIYKGYAGGYHYTHSGGSGNPICLPRRPQYGAYAGGQQNTGIVYGTEYETNYFPPLKTLHNGEAPCVVCKTTRTAVIMIPARKQCTKGWSREYHGYLMAGNYSHKSASGFICVDHKPETITGDRSDQNGNLLYLVEAKCGALKCPPYNNNKELTCVVCSA